ncbi:MAG: glycosyltransferase family 4 protein [Candidatus Sumerlaeia bacterium]|nr:glycosyltransferase family 4 protein [Candidatus Sumerlaeia bacterium]
MGSSPTTPTTSARCSRTRGAVPIRLRVLHIVSKYPPAMGGSELATQRLARALAARGHEAHVLTLAHPGLPVGEREEDGVRVHRVLRPAPLGPLWGLGYMRQIAGWLGSREPFGAIHCRGLYLHSIPAASAGKRTGARVFSTIASTGALHDLEGLLGHRLGRMLAARALAAPAQLIALSPASEAETLAILRREALPAPPIHVVPNFVEWPRTVRPPGARPSHRLLFLGRLEPVKRPDLALEALRIARETIADLELRVVGDGSLREGLEARVAELGLGAAVTFAGRVEDPRGELDSASALILPSDTEGLSNAMLEAMAWGVPVVATDVGGARDALGEPRLEPELGLPAPAEAGYLALAGDAHGLAKAVVSLLSQGDNRAGKGAAARRRCEALYSADAVLEKLLALYRGAVPLRSRA